MIKVLLFEDNKPLRDSMQLVISHSDGFSCVAALAHANNAVKDVQYYQPDIILMDIDMPGTNGIQAVKELKAAFPDLKILMQTVFDENEKIMDSILAGANGYLLKNTPPQDLLQGISDLMEGAAPMSKAVAVKVLNMFKENLPRDQKENFSLSVRELEVLHQLAQGKILKEIASDLGVSFFTVQSHVKNIYEKMQVRSKAEAVAKALKNKLFFLW